MLQPEMFFSESTDGTGTALRLIVQRSPCNRETKSTTSRADLLFLHSSEDPLFKTKWFSRCTPFNFTKNCKKLVTFVK